MSIEPAKKIPESPLIRREENAIQPRRKKPKQQKKEEKEGQRKVDIKV